MRKDPTEFRRRFLRWKRGISVYDGGVIIPEYEGGKDHQEMILNQVDDMQHPFSVDFIIRNAKYRPNVVKPSLVLNVFNNTNISESPYLKETTGGYYNINRDSITLNSNTINKNNVGPTVAHEIRHAMDDLLFDAFNNNHKYLTLLEHQYIDSAYGDPGAFSGDLSEKIATNAEMRYRIQKNHGSVWGEKLDEVIDKSSDKEILSLLNTNAYINKEKYMLQPIPATDSILLTQDWLKKKSNRKIYDQVYKYDSWINAKDAQKQYGVTDQLMNTAKDFLNNMDLEMLLNIRDHINWEKANQYRQHTIDPLKAKAIREAMKNVAQVLLNTEDGLLYALDGKDSGDGSSIIRYKPGIVIDNKGTYWKQFGEAIRRTADPKELYNYIGYFNKYGTVNPRDSKTGHYTDEFKLPGHPTFSDESFYNNPRTPGGHWHNDNHYEFSNYGFNRSDATLNYLKKVDPNVIATYKGGIVLPSVTVFGKRANTKNSRLKYNDYLTTSNDATQVISRNPIIRSIKSINPHLTERANQGAKAHAAWEEEHPILNTVGLGLSTIPFVAAASPTIAPTGEAFAGTTLAGISAPMWTDAALTAGFGAHGLDHAINEGIGGLGDAAITALEIAPLGRLVKPVYKGVIQPGMRLFNSPLTGNWTKIGNREYRLSPNSLGANGSPIESRVVAQQITAENAARMTPEQWTAAQDAAIARGDMAEAQRLRDLHFKANASKTKAIKPNGQPLELYHGTGKNFNFFDDNKIGTNYLDLGYYGRGHYFTPSKDAAEGYASVNTTPVVYKVYGNFKNPKVMSLEDESMIGKTIKNNDSVIAGLDDIDYSEYVAKTGKQVKSADAVTYDNNHIRIPLGKRDNFNINDIRYGLLPFGIGLTVYGLSNWNDVKFPTKRKIK